MLPSLLKAFKPTRVIPFLNPKPSNSTGLSLKGLLYYSPPSSILCINKGCCCCQVASVVSDSVQPHRWQPTRLLYPWDSPSKNIGVGCHFLLQCMKVKSLSHVRLLATPWTAAYQTPPSMGFSRQEHCSGCHCLLQICP